MMTFREEISGEEVAGLELIQFGGPISLVSDEEAFGQILPDLRSCPVLGFDTETRPSFKKGKTYPTSLIQLSSENQAWLIRVSRMGYPKGLLDILSDEKVLKVGSGLNDDIRRMKADFSFEPAGFLDLQTYVEAFRIGEKGLKKMSAIVLGKRISKSQQVSNWDSDRLTEAQLRYAATDAWICLEIYNALRKTLSLHG